MSIDWKKMAPAILTGVSIVGVGVSVVLAARCHAKAMPELVKAKEENPDISKKELVQRTWKYYIPVAVSTGVTVTAIVMSHKLSAAQLASMTAAATAAISQKERIKSKVKSTIGEDNWAKVEKALGDDASKTVADMGEGKPGEVIFYDTFTNEAFYANPETVKDAVYSINRIMALEGAASLGDFYELIGREPNWYAHEYGWSLDFGSQNEEYCWIDIELEYNEEVGGDGVYYRINYLTEPSTAFELDEFKINARSAIERANQAQGMG